MYCITAQVTTLGDFISFSIQFNFILFPTQLQELLAPTTSSRINQSRGAMRVSIKKEKN